MLRLIGALVVLLLLIGPLLEQGGLMPDSGLLHDFVALEVRAFVSAANWFRGLVESHTPSTQP